MLRQYISNMIVCILWDSSWTHINRHNINVPFCFLLHFISILLVIPFVTCLLLDFSLYSTSGGRELLRSSLFMSLMPLCQVAYCYSISWGTFFFVEREKRKNFQRGMAHWISVIRYYRCFVFARMLVIGRFFLSLLLIVHRFFSLPIGKMYTVSEN